MDNGNIFHLRKLRDYLEKYRAAREAENADLEKLYWAKVRRRVSFARKHIEQLKEILARREFHKNDTYLKRMVESYEQEVAAAEPVLADHPEWEILDILHGAEMQGAK